MSFFIPFSSYESRLFLARRLAGVPGYQFDVDMSKEYFQRQVFAPDEVQMLVEFFQSTPGHEYRRHMVFDEKMYLVEMKRIDELKNSNEHFGTTLDNMDRDSNDFGHYKSFDENHNQSDEIEEDTKFMLDTLGLKHPSELLITHVDESNIQMYLNDRKFKELSLKDQTLVKIANHQVKMISNCYTKPLYEASISLIMFIMEKQLIRMK